MFLGTTDCLEEDISLAIEEVEALTQMEVRWLGNGAGLFANNRLLLAVERKKEIDAKTTIWYLFGEWQDLFSEPEDPCT